MVLIHTGKAELAIHATRQVDDLLAELNDASEIATFHKLGQERVYAMMAEGASGGAINLEFGLSSWGKVEAPHSAFYGMVAGTEVAAWWKQFGELLFVKNLRSTLGHTEVNRQILATIEDRPDDFWYFNNGITVTAKSVEKTAAGAGNRELGNFKAVGAHVVNGAQTVTLTAGGTISSFASIASNGGNITINTAQSFTLGSSLNASARQVLLQTGSLQSASYQTITASSVVVSAPAALRLYGNVTGAVSVAGTVSGGDGTRSLTVGGALTLQATATTGVKLGGGSQGANYGSISATGSIAVAGALDVTFANGFEDQITNGYTFTILSGVSLTGTFTGLPNNSRIVFPNELGSVKINYTATAVTLSDWLPFIRELTWDPGTADTGTQVLTNTSTRAGRHYFHINAQATDIGAWKTRLTVATGEADLYLSQTAVPQTTASIPRQSQIRTHRLRWPRPAQRRVCRRAGLVSPRQRHRRRAMEHLHRCRISARSPGPTRTPIRNTTSANPRSLPAVEP